MTKKVLQSKTIEGGVTLVELTIAVALSAVLAASVFFTWNYLTRHTTIQNRRTAIRAEGNRITNQLSLQLRRAESIINLDNSSIQFTVNNRADTISYVFSGSEMTYNQQPISFTIPAIEVSNFTITDNNENNPAKPYLFTCSLTLTHTSGDTITSTATIFVNRTTAVPQEDSFSW